jgi:hypothetical protein
VFAEWERLDNSSAVANRNRPRINFALNKRLASPLSLNTRTSASTAASKRGRVNILFNTKRTAASLLLPFAILKVEASTRAASSKFP